jgi:NAD(P)-dependent dehydrogenase (short-subunit alcohol dehydrogenase family)
MRGARNNFMYPAAKAGVITLTKSLALTWARDGIRVNCIAPGFFATHRPVEEYEARGRLMPAGRVGKPAEIGPLAVYLASEASSYITGGVFLIDGAALAGGYAPTAYTPVIPLPDIVK